MRTLPNKAEASQRSRWKVIRRIILIGIGVITMLPVFAVFDPVTTLEVSYGVKDIDRMVEVLLQHRGVLQFVVGAGIVWAAFYQPVRIPIAFSAMMIKSYFTLSILPNITLRSQWPVPVAIFDIVSILFLALVAVDEWRKRGK
jgi:hypothetical protein